MKKKFQITMANAVTESCNAKGEKYTMQDVVLHEIEQPEGEKPFYVVVKLFNKLALKQGDKVEAELRFDVRQFNGRNYNQIDVTELNIIKEDKPF